MGTGFSCLQIVQGPEVCERSAEKERLEIQSTPSKRTPLQDGHLVLVLVVFQSFYCNYTLYNMDTSLRRTPGVDPCCFLVILL